MKISYLLYFVFAAISIIGMGITGWIISNKQGNEKPYNIPKPKIVYILSIWVLLYVIVFLSEWLGHLVGLWTWSNTNYIFLHAGYWWATFLTTAILSLSALKPLLRYFIILIWVLLFEFLQEALIHWVTHFPLLGNPFLMITIVMSASCSVSFKALEIIKKIGLLSEKD